MFSRQRNVIKFLVLLLIVKFTCSREIVTTNPVGDREGRIFGSVNDKTSLQAAVMLGISLMVCTPPADEVKTCTINVKKLDPSHSLLIEAMDHTEFRYPDDQGFIHMLEGEPIFLSCPGEGNHLKMSKVQSVTAICACETVFKLETGEITDFNTFVCERPPESKLVFKGFYGRESVFRKYEIGFYTDDTNRQPKFLKLMSINYDSLGTSTMHVRSVISKSIAGSQKTAKNKRFDQQFCCESLPINMDIVYKAETQDESFGNQMKCHKEKKCSYLDVSKDILFNRGHLTPKSTFVYTAAGVATFRYVNTAPQWKPVNDGNWARIEEHITDMAAKLKKDLVTITGVLGSLRLPDTSDLDTEKFIHLYDKDNVKAMQVPLYFYKLVYEDGGNRGIVYVTVNNPFIKEDLHEYHICRVPITRITGGKVPLKWKPKLTSKGYSYICEVSDFLEHNFLIFDDPAVEKITELLYLPSNEIEDNKVEIDTVEQNNEIEVTTSHLTPRDELKRRSLE